jgi:hypothetical protein
MMARAIDVIGAFVPCLPIGQEYLLAGILRYILRFHAPWLSWTLFDTLQHTLLRHAP